jgi:transcriptional regulator with XRE-family HTH domain
MATILDLRNELTKFKNSGPGVAHDLRLNLADVIFRHLQAKNWTQSDLADAAGVKAPYITRILHSSQNWTTETAGQILYALGIRLEFLEKPLSQSENQPQKREEFYDGQSCEKNGVDIKSDQECIGTEKKPAIIGRIGPANWTLAGRAAEISARG